VSEHSSIERGPRPYPTGRHRVVGLADALVDWSNCNSEGKRLSQNAKIAYELIAGFPEAWFSVRWLAARLGRAPSTARAALAELQLAGWIRREERFDKQTGAQTSNRFRILRRPGDPVPCTRSAEDNDGPAELDESAAARAMEPSDVGREVLDFAPAREDAPSLDALREELRTLRASASDDASLETSTPQCELPLPSHAGPACERAALTQETLRDLLDAFGTKRVRLLEQEFATPRWLVPGVAEAASRLLLERRKRRPIQFVHHYVSSLYANALELAQHNPLPPGPGFRPRPKPKGTTDDSLDQLLAYKAELHARIADVDQRQGRETDRIRFYAELNRVCRLILHRQSELERAAS
jgi:hypothetical protein